MSGQLEAYVLPIIAVLAVAVTATALVLLVVRLLHQVGAALTLARTGEDGQYSVNRRCDDCGKGWLTYMGRDVSLLRLLVARAVRRYYTTRDRGIPGWAGPRGWKRCPSCLSQRVRTSGEPVRHPSRAAPSRLPVYLGAVAALAGLVLLAAASVGLVASSSA